MTNINPSQSTASSDSIELRIDAHAQYYWVSRLGRSAAQRLGLRCVGLIGFLMEAKRRGLITDAVGTAELLCEKAGFWVSQELLIYFGTVDVRRRFQI